MYGKMYIKRDTLGIIDCFSNCVKKLLNKLFSHCVLYVFFLCILYFVDLFIKIYTIIFGGQCSAPLTDIYAPIHESMNISLHSQFGVVHEKVKYEITLT